MMLSMRAETIILSAPPTESMMLSAPQKHRHRNVFFVSSLSRHPVILFCFVLLEGKGKQSTSVICQVFRDVGSYTSRGSPSICPRSHGFFFLRGTSPSGSDISCTSRFYVLPLASECPGQFFSNWAPQPTIDGTKK